MVIPLILIILLACPVNSETEVCPSDDNSPLLAQENLFVQTQDSRRMLAMASSMHAEENVTAGWPEDKQVPEESFLQSMTPATTGSGSTAMNPKYGRIVTIGDSMFAVSRNHKKVFIEALSGLLGTEVIVNAVSGAGMGAISRQGSCSQDPQCKWLVMNDAPARACGSESWKKQFKGLLDRELASNRKVIVVGYPTFLLIEPDVTQYNLVMDLYKQAATDNDNVWFLDPRDNPIWQSDLSWYAKDKKHPAEKGEIVFAEGIAKIIKENSLTASSSTSTATSSSSTSTAIASSSTSTATTSRSTSMATASSSTSTATTSSSTPMATASSSTSTATTSSSATPNPTPAPAPSPADCSPACEDEFLNRCVPHFLRRNWSRKQVFDRCTRKLTVFRGPITRKCKQGCKLTQAMKMP